jgi:single-stranded-DNA-specific exonuclease
MPVEEAHAVVPAGALTLDLAEELDRLAPFGAGNPAPVLMVPAARVEHVTAMGEQRDHARFTLAGGSARARGVAFRTSQRELAEAGARDLDVAVALERNHWNGAVEARVVLRSLCPTRAGAIEDLAPEPDVVTAIEQELAADPGAWWPAPAHDRPARRPVSDRRGEGLAGLAGDLLTSGESVLLIVTDVVRRRAALEAMVAGMAPGRLPVASWEATGAAPLLADGFDHVVALDPPPVADGLALLGASRATIHLAWGVAERAFTLASWRDRLALRPSLIDLWRALDSAGALAGADLETALRGAGRHPRDSRHCGRLVRVLCELELARWDSAAAPRLLRGPVGRTDLQRSTANRAYATRLVAVERHLATPERSASRAAV